MTSPTSSLNDQILLNVLSLSNDATAVYDSEALNIRFVNDAMLKIWGKDKSIVGKTFEQAIPEIIGQQFTALLREVWRSGKTFAAKDTPADLMVDGKLQTFFFDFEYRAIRNENGETFCLLHTAIDVSERLKAWQLVKEKEEQEQALNEELTATNEELSSLNNEYVALNEELESSNEEINAAYDQLSEIHERLIIVEQQARLAKEAAALGMFDLDVVNDTLQWDERCKELFGVDPDKEVSYTNDFITGLHPDDRVPVQQAVDRAYNKLLSGGQYDVEYRTISPNNGDLRWVRAIGQVHFDKDDKPVRFIGTVIDMTEAIKVRTLLEEREAKLHSYNEELAASNEEIYSSNEELMAINEELNSANDQVINLNEKLTKSENEFRELIQDAPVAMLVFKGPDMKIDLINSAMLRLIGREPDILDKPLFEAVPELQGQAAADLLFEVYHTGKPVYGNETPVSLIRNGKEQLGYFNFTYTPLIQEGEVKGVIDMAVDVTEQVKTRMHLEEIIEEKTVLGKTLRSSELRLQGILDTMAEGVAIVDKDGEIVYTNLLAQRILGLIEGEKEEGTFYNTKWQNLKLDGTLLPESEHPISVMLRTGMSIYDQEICVQPTDGERFYISINAAPILDESNTLTGGIATFMDVTSRRKLTMQKDDFISVASHELKTPVTTLKASLQLLARLKDSISPEMLSKLLMQANRSLDKLSSLINDLLNSNRISQGQLQIHKTTFSVAGMINDCCQHIRTAGIHDIILKGDMDVTVSADEQQIDQVVVNFVNNAVKYAPESKEIIIEVTKQADNLRIAVRDQGPGIPAEQIPHLFDRYYRADYSGTQFSGLGLGLYICAEIIKKHGGEIGVDTELGKGSSFWFTLPS